MMDDVEGHLDWLGDKYLTVQGAASTEGSLSGARSLSPAGSGPPFSRGCSTLKPAQRLLLNPGPQTGRALGNLPPHLVELRSHCPANLL